MKRFFVLVLSGISLVSCVPDHQLTPVDPYYLFHDNSSKMWLINHLYKNGKDFAPMSNKYKDIVTFYKSNNCYIQRMHTFGDEPGRKAGFWISAKQKEVKLSFAKEQWNFDLTYISPEKIILKAKETNPEEMRYTLEIIPVPEP